MYQRKRIKKQRKTSPIYDSDIALYQKKNVYFKHIFYECVNHTTFLCCTLADEQFYGATQIVDLFHAREHYWTVAKAFFGQDKDKLYLWAEDRRNELNDGRVEDVINAIKACSLLSGCNNLIYEREIGYFEKNKERMRYAHFRKRGLFVDSGVLEAGCRTVVGQRLKQSGMHWTVEGANSIIALHCSILILSSVQRNTIYDPWPTAQPSYGLRFRSKFL